MPGPSSNPALTADLGRNLRDRHPEIFRRDRPAPVVIPGSVPVSTPAPALPPSPRRTSLWGRFAAAVLGLGFGTK